MRSAVIISTAYLPPVQWFSKLVANDVIYMEYQESYHKQTFRNRCMIDSPNGPISLTLPVEKPCDGSRLISRMGISNHDNWREKHWHAIESAYDNSPFFEFYEDDFRPFYEDHYYNLIEFNQSLINKCLKLMGLEVQLISTDHFVHPDEAVSEGVKDYRQMISPKLDWREDHEFEPVPYYQVFAQKSGFKPNLSIIDLIFNMGPESRLVLRNSVSQGV